MAEVKHCQSCGMPLKDDERTGKAGLEPRYCSLCYVNGDFVVKGMNAKEFQNHIYARLQENGWNRLFAWAGTRHIPRLARWRQSNPDKL